VFNNFEISGVKLKFQGVKRDRGVGKEMLIETLCFGKPDFKKNPIFNRVYQFTLQVIYLHFVKEKSFLSYVFKKPYS
jgi:hypothetical protein